MAVEFPWRKESIGTYLDHLSYLVNPPHSQVYSMNSSSQVFGGAFQHAWPADEVGNGAGKDGREYGANVLQPEPQNCDPPRRALLEEKKKKKKKSNGFSGILFSVHI